MPTKKNTRRTRAKKTTTTKEQKKLPLKQRFLAAVKRFKRRVSDFRKRRPHHSFRLTRRRDYTRSLKLPSYTMFSIDVLATLGKYKKTYIGIIIIYSLITIFMGGMVSQDSYRDIADTFNQSLGEIPAGNFASLAKAGGMALSAFSGGSTEISEVQQVYLSIMTIATWLVIVWLLREQLAGRKPKIRDGMYNSMAPLFSMTAVVIVGLLQLIPMGIAILIYTGLASTGLVASGFGAMLYGVVLALVGTLTMYWLTSTFIAFVIVTLPGMYPMRALSLAGDLVVGRRLRITLRFIWGLLLALTFWFIVMIPVILLENWLSGKWEWFAALPITPIFAVIASSCVIVWLASYIYLLYRKVVADDAAPA